MSAQSQRDLVPISEQTIRRILSGKPLTTGNGVIVP
jgi:hypothetical protein